MPIRPFHFGSVKPKRLFGNSSRFTRLVLKPTTKICNRSGIHKRCGGMLAGGRSAACGL
jgi:hypothetical protein